MCVYGSIYVCVHELCMHACMYVQACEYVYECVLMNAYECVCMHIHVCVCVYVYVVCLSALHRYLKAWS